MHNMIPVFPVPANEPILEFRPGSPERAALIAELKHQAAGRVEIPLVIGGREVRTGKTAEVIVPHHHHHVLATVHLAGEAEIDAAARAALAAHAEWAAMPPETRAAIFLRAADLAAGPWRQRLNAATMLNQSKTCHQAEIDAACELIDFFRFNAVYMRELYEGLQPPISPPGVWNAMECRPLEGFVYAITPFNFTSIAANLPHAPALMGNTVVWKPSPSAPLSNYVVMRLFEAAGLPPGVINFLPGDAETVSARLFAHPEFAGLHFTGSTAVFRELWNAIGQNLSGLRNYPRIVGETGGKDFIVAHTSADPDALRTAMIRGAYEFQGQKCSAASRAYVPRSVWSIVRDGLVAEIEAIRMGDVADFENFMGAVIHRRSFEKCGRYIEQARSLSDVTIAAGGQLHDAEGFFVRPTLIEAHDPLAPRSLQPHVTLRADGGDLRRRAAGDRDGPRSPALRGRQLLHQRQADRRGRGAAALRRGPGERNQRQGGQRPQPASLGQPPNDQGDVRAAARVPVPVYGGGVMAVSGRARSSGAGTTECAKSR
jgi:1-pyrroline-5-carboxylate dehydrogenase